MLSFSNIFTLGSYIGNCSKKGSNISKNVLFDLLPVLYQKGFSSPIYYSGKYNRQEDKVDIMIGNHLNVLDFTIYVSIIRQFDNRDIYLIFKKTLIFIPAAGFIISSSNDIKLNRNYNDDKNNIMNSLKNIKSGIILLLPEGTRFTALKKELSHNYSTTNNLHKFNNILYPKMKGLWLICNCLTELNRMGNIIDLSIVVENYKNKECKTLDLLKKKLGNTYCVISSYQTDSSNIIEYDNFKEWFLDLWKEKDNIVGRMLTRNDNYIYRKLDNSISNSSYMLLILVTSLFIYLMVITKGLFLPISLLVTYIISIVKYKNI